MGVACSTACCPSSQLPVSLSLPFCLPLYPSFTLAFLFSAVCSDSGGMMRQLTRFIQGVRRGRVVVVVASECGVTFGGREVWAANGGIRWWTTGGERWWWSR